MNTQNPTGSSIRTSISVTKPDTMKFPTISAVKKNNKATIIAPKGRVYNLDLGGALGRNFKSSKKKVATVDSTGLVMVNGAGQTKITFSVGKKKRTVTLKVIDPTVPTRVSLIMSAGTPRVGQTVILEVKLPEGTNSDIIWKSNRKSIASVDNGVVTFKKPGTVTITAICKRGKKKARMKFKVS